MLGFYFNHNVDQGSEYNFGISPLSLSLDNGSNLGVTMPLNRLNPLVKGELVPQVPCSREKIDCKDGFQGTLIGDDSERQLADDLGVGTLFRQVFQGM